MLLTRLVTRLWAAAGGARWRPLQTYIRKSRRIYELLHSCKRVTGVLTEPLFVELKEIVRWFDDWRADLIAADPSGKRWPKRFISDKTYQDLHWAVDGVIAMLRSYFHDYRSEDNLGAQTGNVGRGSPGAIVNDDSDTVVSGTARGAADAASDAATPNACQRMPLRPAASPATPVARSKTTTRASKPSSEVKKRIGRSTATKAQHRSNGLTSCTALFNQNVVENTFGIIRQRSGGSVNAMQHTSGIAGARALHGASSSRHGHALSTPKDVIY